MCAAASTIIRGTVRCRHIGRHPHADSHRFEFVRAHHQEIFLIIKKMTSIHNFQMTKIAVGDICQKGKTRIANITDDKGKPIKIVLSKDCVLRTPWNVSSYDGSTRCSLDIMINGDLRNLVDKIDTDVFTWISKDSNRYFKTPPKDLASWYKSLRKEASKEGYSDTLRTKCTISEDKASFKCWDEERRQMSVSEIRKINWPQTTFACEVALKGVYFQSNSFGVMLEVTNVMIRPEDESCPFEETED